MPSRRARIGVSFLIGAVTAVYVFLVWRNPTTTHPDFWEPWFTAKAILNGVDPYPLIGPGRSVANQFLLIYPLTAGIAVLPLALLNLINATMVFVALSAGFLAYAITADGWHRLPLFLSFPFVAAAWAGQWSPIFSAAFLLPGLAWLYVAKPSLGIAFLVSTASRRVFVVGGIGAVLLTAVAFVAVPSWLSEWMNALRSVHHMTPAVLKPGGAIALLVLLRWRRPEARLIVALACVPQTALWYEALPLLLVPNHFRESLLMSLAVSLPIAYELAFGLNDGTFDVYPRGFQLALFAYLPAVSIVLFRPNEGAMPAWLQMLTTRRPVSG